MPTLSRILSSAVEKLLFHPASITGVEAVGESFRLITMQGIGFRRIRLTLQTSQNPLCSSGMKPRSPLPKHYTFAADKRALPDSSSK